MQRNPMLTVGLLVLAIAGASSAGAQMMRHSGGADGQLLILNELGVVAGPKEGTDDLEVVSLLPDAAGKSDVVIKRGDLLSMIGGKRIRDVATLREAYNGAQVGDTVKIGFRRGDERFLVSFDKEPEAAGGRRVVMMGGPGAGGDLQPLMEFGVVLTEKDGKVVVGMEIPTGDHALAKDDVITAVNGQAVDSLDAFRKIYEGVAVGADLDLVYARNGEEDTLTRARSDSAGAIRMRRSP